MRTLASIVNTMKLNPSDDISDLHSNLHKFKPFLFSDINTDKINLSSKDFCYLPFKHCSIDFTAPIEFSEKEQRQFVERLCRDLNIKPFSSPILLGFILIENNDLSVTEIFVFADAAKENGQMHDFSNINENPGYCVFSKLNFKDYSEYNSSAKTVKWIRVLFDKKSFVGISSNGFRIKRQGREPEFVKKIVIISRVAAIRQSIKSVGKIEWKHQWRVRGHWRKISPNMIGKDREGEYVIVGNTWIKDFVKGDGPLIEKTRILKGEKNGIFEHSNVNW